MAQAGQSQRTDRTVQRTCRTDQMTGRTTYQRTVRAGWRACITGQKTCSAGRIRGNLIIERDKLSSFMYFRNNTVFVVLTALMFLIQYTVYKIRKMIIYTIYVLISLKSTSARF
jgi:hypothetical protein